MSVSASGETGRVATSVSCFGRLGQLYRVKVWAAVVSLSHKIKSDFHFVLTHLTRSMHQNAYTSTMTLVYSINEHKG